MNLPSDGLQALKQHLSSIPSLEVDEVSPDEFEDASPDIALRVRYAGGEQVIFADVKSSGQPRYARQAGDRFFRLRSQQPSIYGVFILLRGGNHPASAGGGSRAPLLKWVYATRSQPQPIQRIWYQLSSGLEPARP